MQAFVYGFAAIGIFVTLLVLAGIGYCLSAQDEGRDEKIDKGDEE